jgi:hypothetical protein
MRIISFKLCKLKRLKVFSLWYLASRARSRSSTNPTYCTDLSPSLDFSGSVGFGTWRIFVHFTISCFTNFWLFGLLADTSLLSLLFFILELFICDFLIICLPFVLLRQKGGVSLFLDRDCIFKPVKCFFLFFLKWPTMGVSLLATLCWQKHYIVGCCFNRDTVLF